MSLIARVYASAPSDQVIIPTLEILTDPVIRVAAAFEDVTATLETEEEVTFLAGPFEHQLPARDTSGQQTLRFSVANAAGIAQEAVEQALESDDAVEIVYREFLSSDLTAPAKAPIRMTMRGGSFEGLMVQFEAGYFDLLNTAWPRDRYTAEFAPGLRYI